MKRSKISLVLKALISVVGAVSLQACFYGGHPYYSQAEPYGYAPAPAYGYARPPAYAYAPRVGDYDEHHQWHDRNWWVQNNHVWVQHHHPDWIATREHGHDHDEH
ncbi:MAG TPA: hypothetical protein VNE82_10405 [Candidatus Binataceae bacterium]|nr:hypothetical protein [Candidatus Binataceae bacterium]